MSQLKLHNPGRVALLATDVDGVLTDGGMYFGPHGQAMKRFDVKDGYGLKMLQRSGVPVAWITADDSAITRARAEALRIDVVRNGVAEKLEALIQVARQLDCGMDAVVYMGDDLNDLPVCGKVGSFVAVADAVEQVHRVADAVTSAPGGYGAVRQVCEAIIEHNRRFG
ncbi:MAG: HAD hydrolase family protein [candidate division WS1 bacterium]|jgi:3-deoxy-D-manno-octulosonate 8-phosphate phosphatase (KDO 8-P phosphatase)|nr:HAD hydrolase family protein [candidate division WS1 bacterium]